MASIMFSRIFTLLSPTATPPTPTGAGAQQGTSGPPVASAPAPFTVRHASQPAAVGNSGVKGAPRPEARHQQLVGMALETLQRAIRRSSVSDLAAAAADLGRVARDAGKSPADLINALDPSGDMVLHHMAHAKADVAEKLAVLLSTGCDLRGRNRQGENVLHLAARYNNVALVDALASRAGELIHSATARIGEYTEATPLAIAVHAGQAAAVRKLALLGASIKEPCCLDSDGKPLTAQELYGQLGKPTPEMATALRTGRSAP